MQSEKLPLMGLGYVGIGAPDPKAWNNFATQVCGLMPAPIPPVDSATAPLLPDPNSDGSGDDGSLFFKMDDRQWRLAIHPSETPGMQYFGLELATLRAVDQALETLSAQGVEVRAGTPEECRARGVQAMAVTQDPAGSRVELFASPIRDKGFVSPQGVEFKTGPLGMGHVFLMTPDIPANLDFYMRILGFERTDYMNFAPESSVQFLRCTPRHHSVGLMCAGPARGLQHIMFEVTSIDDVGLTLDRAMAAGVKITTSLGRHRNDGTFSFYMEGPSGFDIEIGCHAVLIDDDWVEHEFAGDGDDWGHHGLGGESMVRDVNLQED